MPVQGTKYVPACSLLESRTNIAILRPGPAVQRPLRAGAASALPSQEPLVGLWMCGTGWDGKPAPHTAPHLAAQASRSHRLRGGSSSIKDTEVCIPEGKEMYF